MSRMIRRSLNGLARSLSPLGMMAGALFFAASLTPSLVPRDFLLQGALSGLAFAVGYFVGLLLQAGWFHLELPPPSDRVRRVTLPLAGGASALLIAGVLWKAADWQDSIRVLMELEPVHTARPLEVGVIALVVFLLLLMLARLVLWLQGLFARRLQRRVPTRSARLLGAVLAALLVWAAIDGLLFRAALRVADSSFRGLDSLMDADIARPDDPLKTGSPASLLSWEGLGRMGRAYVASGPTADEIAAITGKPAMQPLRVYAGLNSADTVQERAALALAELQRVGGFDRSVLVVVTPTGTGWIDPAAADTLDVLHHGDVASVGMQYSYLASWLSLLVEPDYGSEAARALFDAVYGHWTTLPRDRRPRLYLYGLSLGALNSDRSSELYSMIADPIQGAFWVGPPFPSRTWNAVTAGRMPSSPAWLPRFRDGSIVRFANQDGWAPGAYAPWGPIRLAYLQYASDPIVFFAPSAAWREPAWMLRPRGPDVSPALRWFPLVTLLQLGLDIAIGTTTPMGHGHVYAPEHHIDPWIEITQPPGWTPQAVAALKAHFSGLRAAP